MKKLIVMAAVAALALGSLNVNAQAKQYNFDLSCFNSIIIGSEFEVTINQGDECKANITVEEPYREYVICAVRGQVLSIDIDEKKVPSDVKRLYKGKGAVVPVFKAVITTPDNISVITLKDKAKLSSVKDLNVESFKIDVSDNATLSALVVNTKSAVINVDKRGSASLDLITEDLILDVKGNSTLNLSQTSRTIDAKIGGFSNLSMHGDADSLAFNCKGNSKVIINGTIPTVNYILNGGCNVDAQNIVCNNAVVKMNGVCTLSEAASETLSVEISGGATLIFNNKPAITIEEIKNSNMRKYSSTVKK